MAVVSVAFDGTRLDTADSLGSVWTDTGGKAANAEPDFVYQRSSGTDGSVSEKVGTSALGVGYTDGTGVDMSGPNQIALFKVLATNAGIMNAEGPTGGTIEMGSGGRRSAFYEWYVVGGDTYPPSQSWLFPFIDPNVSAFYDATTSSPNLNAFDWFGWECEFSASSKSENVAMDAIGHVTSGKGLTLTAGDTAPAGNYADFVAEDEGILANRWGIVSTRSEVIFCHLTLTVGSATATVFTSVNEQITFPFLRVGEGAQGLAFDLASASTAITLTNGVFKSVGRDNLKRFFDTDHQVDPTPDDLSIVAHGFVTGEAVLYSKEGGAEAIGLTDATEYFVEATDADSIELHATRQAAITSGTPVALTASTVGNGENHSLRRQPMTTFHATVTGTSGTMVVTSCNFIRPGTITSTSKPTWTTCSFVEPWSVVPAGASFTSCVFSGAMTVEGEWLISGTVAELEAFVSNTFTAGDYGGHGWRITGAASALDITGNGWVGYGPDPEDGNGHSFSTELDVDGTNDEIDYVGHLWTTGDPAYYSRYDPTDGSLGTEAIGMADGDLVYVRSVTVDSFSLHATRYGAENNLDKIGLTASGGGSGENHTFYSANAAIVNGTAGAVTVNVTAGDTPSIRNLLGATTSVQNTVSVTITVKDKDLALLEGARVLVYDDTTDPGDFGGIVRKETNASGVASESYNFGGEITVNVVVRKKGKVPVRQNQALGAGGLSLTIIVENDSIVE